MSGSKSENHVSFFSNLVNSNWAIEPSVGQSLLPIALRLMKGEKVTFFANENREKNRIEIYEPVTGIKSLFGKWNLSHQLDSRGKSLHDPGSTFNGDVITEGSVAVLYLTGPMFKRAEGFDALCGAVGTGAVSARLRELADNPQISGIVLSIDSCGGTVDGTEELGNAVSETTKKKPVIALVDGMAASAAYWVASQATEIQMKGDTSMVGSIGVVTSHTDFSEYLKQAGMDVKYLTNTDATHKVVAPPNGPLSEPDHDYLVNELLNPLAEQFQKTVLKSRKLDKENQASAFSGRMFLSKDAIKIGLADKIGSISTAIKAAGNSSNKTKMSGIKLDQNLDNPEEDKEIIQDESEKQEVLEDQKVEETKENPAEVVAEPSEELVASLRNEITSLKAQLAAGKETKPAAQSPKPNHTSVNGSDTVISSDAKQVKKTGMSGILAANKKLKAKK